MTREYGHNTGDKIAYREYVIGKYRADGWWIERDSTVISHYCGSIEIAKRIIDEIAE